MTVETAPAMHLEARGIAAVPCDTCGTVFTPRRGWGRFCSTRCRNAFHGAEKRKDAIKASALDLYEALRMVREVIRGNDAEHIWLNHPTEPAETPGTRIDRILGKLKPPVEPKALLEKAKA
jgi:hypothetical protein